MLVLIAESKTMSVDEHPVSEVDYEMHKPLFEEFADEEIKFLKSLSQAELSERLGFSNTLALKCRKFIYEFADKSLGNKALDSFKGEVFRALDFQSLPEEAKEFGEKNIMIVSSLYGLLNPDDIIKPYRLEFNKNCSPGGGNMIKFYKQKVTIALVKRLKETNENEILDLLPGDAAKCFDWKLIKAFAKVNKVDFKNIDNKGDLKTPSTGRLKELRGKLLRKILIDNIDNLEKIQTIESSSFSFSDDLSKPGYSVFIN